MEKWHVQEKEVTTAQGTAMEHQVPVVVYEVRQGARFVATFVSREDAERAVEAVNNPGWRS